jgi:hypothetical protein
MEVHAHASVGVCVILSLMARGEIMLQVCAKVCWCVRRYIQRKEEPSGVISEGHFP